MDDSYQLEYQQTRRTVAKAKIFFSFEEWQPSTTQLLDLHFFLICTLLDCTPFLDATVAGFGGKVDGNFPGFPAFSLAMFDIPSNAF